jgi:mannose-6-phosphate isomerase-like protein (cupin superfamily)
MGRPKKKDTTEVQADVPVKPKKELPPLCQPLTALTPTSPNMTEWGSFVPIDSGQKWKVRKVKLSPGRTYTAKITETQEELWTILEGEGVLTQEGSLTKERRLIPKDMVLIWPNSSFSVKAGMEALIFLEAKLEN